MTDDMLVGKLHFCIVYYSVIYTINSNSFKFYGILDNEGLGANINMVSTFWNEIPGLQYFCRVGNK